MHERDIFTEALKRPGAAERAAYLDEACADDGALRERLEELLAFHACDHALLDRRPAELLEALGATASGDGRPPEARRRAEGCGTVLAGRYTLDLVIGEGGMGTVYRARQTEPVQREVAVKVIKPGMDTRAVLARFEAERQALALMDHPNIARIYDGGVTASGQPFFVMECVRGAPITQFCDARRLPLRARLELFVAVCQAVQHAHRKGIIHRDLKPSNVLVTEVDGRPTPKVIDFGLAKATGTWSTGQSLADLGVVVGTPEYMSPEQADPSCQDIDTRTDVYALGTILYELLAGSPPLDAGKFRRGAILEMLRTVREVDPPRPSARLSTSDTLPHIAANRGTEPAKLTLLLRGELDWVVMKALEKDRNRRYGSANSLALDLERYLAGEAVAAVPPSAGYRLRKFLRRNRGPVLAAALVLVALVLGLLGTSWGMVRAQQAHAEEAHQREEAQRQEKAERWQRYRSNMVAAASALQVQNVTAAREALEAAPSEHRNWEWHHFHHQLDTSRRVLRGPSGVGAVRFSTDGTRAALIYPAVPPHFLDLSTPGETATALEFGSWFSDLSPDGKRIASRFGDNAVVVGNISGGRQRAVLYGPADLHEFPQFSPDGTRLAAGFADGTVRVWDTATGKELLVLRGHQTPPGRLAFSPDGRRLASTGGDDRTVRLWDAYDGHALAVLAGHEDPVRLVAFSPRGDRVLSAQMYPSNVLRLWDGATGKLLGELRGHSNEVRDLAFSPDGTRIATGSHDQTVRLWDGRTGQPLATLHGHRGWVTSVVFSPDGGRLASASQDQTVRLWDAASGAALAVLLGHTAQVLGATYTADGTSIVSCSAEGDLRLWDVPFLERSGVLRGHTKQVYGVAFHPDGIRVASASWDGTARLWDARSGRTIARWRGPEKTPVTAVAFHPAGQLLATLGRDDAVHVWDVGTAKEVHRFDVPTRWFMDSRLAFSPRGDLLATGGPEHVVHIWDVRRRAEVARLSGHTDFVRDVVFARDGSWLASAGELADKTIRIWDVTTRQQLHVLEGHTSGVYALAVSPDGKLLASGATDGTARLWDTFTWKEIAVLTHGSNVYGLAFTPDGTRLACACANNTIRLWDVATCESVGDLAGHGAYVHQVAFSPDGTRLVSGSGDHTVRLWDSLSSQERAARERAAEQR